MPWINSFIAVVLIVLGASVATAKDTDNTDDIVAMAEAKFKATFSQTTAIHAFGPSPIAGLYEMQTQTGILYYYPEKELLVFGKIYNKEGVDLTEQSQRKHNQSIVDRIDLASALILGDEQAEYSYIEITNPTCGYCIDYHRWAKAQDSSGIKRHVLFQASEGAGKAEAIHILCHPDDFDKIYNREKISLKTCPDGEARFKQHSSIMAAIGGVPTPAFIIDGKPFVGFDESILTNLYKRKSHDEETN